MREQMPAGSARAIWRGLVALILLLTLTLAFGASTCLAATYNVRDYGATGSGTTNDTAAIQASIDAAAKSGGGTVYFPSGSYLVTRLFVRGSNVTLAGSGAASVVRSDAEQIITLGSSPPLTGGGVRDLTIIGNYRSEGQIGIRIGGLRNARFERLQMKDMNFAGIFSLGTLENVLFSDNLINHCGDFGIQLKSGAVNNTVTRNTMSGFASLHYPAHGIYLEQAVNTQVTENIVRNVTNAPNMYEVSGIKVTESTGALVESNLVADSYAGVSVPASTNVVVRRNTIRNSSERGLYILSGSRFVVLEYNIVDVAPHGIVFAHYPTWPSDITMHDNTLVNVGIPVVLGETQRVTTSGSLTVSELQSGTRFSDIDASTETGRAALRMMSEGYMSGYSTSYFGPTNPMTREQAAKVSVGVAALHTSPVENVSSPTFSDVLPTRDAAGRPVPYPFDFVEEAAAAGLLNGRAGPSTLLFMPKDKVSRVALAQLVARMIREFKGYTDTYSGDTSSFRDVPTYALADVTLVAKLGVMRGYTEGRFDSWSPAQRGHVALVMTRVLDLPSR